MSRDQLIAIVKAIHDLTNQGNAIQAMQQYYSDNVVMIESDGSATHGLAANLKREEEFFGSITEMREMKITDTFVYDDLVVTISFMDMDINGTPIKGSQASVTEWKDGKVIKEQFIYKTF
jgi:ketosteroid isomerase-like protein